MQQAPVMEPRIGAIEAIGGARDELFFSLRSFEGNDGGLAGLVILDFLQHLLPMRAALGL